MHHGLTILLDMTAAFDTLQHGHLLQKVKDHYGVDDIVLKWLHSYLTDRCCNVVVNGAESKHFKLTTGVRQGSILGPLLFMLFTNNLEMVALRHIVSLHCYADDS